MRAVSLISPEGECKLKFGCQCAIRNSVAFGCQPTGAVGAVFIGAWRRGKGFEPSTQFPACRTEARLP